MDSSCTSVLGALLSTAGLFCSVFIFKLFLNSLKHAFSPHLCVIFNIFSTGALVVSGLLLVNALKMNSDCPIAGESEAPSRDQEEPRVMEMSRYV